MKRNIKICGFKIEGYKIELLIFFVIILLVNTWNLNEYFGIINGVDEYGYLSNALFFLGEDIDPIAHTLSYYSFGYSFFLCPLISFINDSVFLFRAIILLNSIFVALAFLFVAITSIKLHSELKQEIVVLFSFVGFLYVSNFVYSKYVFTECLLTLLISLIFFIFVWMIEDFKTYKLILFGIVPVYMYYVHQRAIVVLLAVVLFLFLFLVRRNISLKQFSVVVFSIVMLFGCGDIIKNILLDNIYIDPTRSMLNDYSGQVSKFDIFFSIEGFKSFILQFMAKIYYFSYSTCLCGPIAVMYCIKQIYNNKFTKQSYYHLILLVMFAGIFSLQAFFLQGTASRYDVVVYGRYAEYIYPILFIEGMIYIYTSTKQKELLSMSLFSYGITIVGIIAANMIFSLNKLTYFEAYLCPALFSTYSLSENLNSGILLSVLISTSIFLFFLFWKKKKTVLVVFLCTFYALFHLNSINEIDKNLCYSQKEYVEKSAEFISYIDAMESKVYFLLDNMSNYQKYRRLQYRLNKSQFDGIYKEDLLEDNIKGYVMIDYTEREVLDDIKLKKLIYDNDGFSLWYLGE